MPRITGLATVIIQGMRFDGVSFDIRKDGSAAWLGTLAASWTQSLHEGSTGALWLPDGELIGFEITGLTDDRRGITARFSSPTGYRP